MLQVEIFCPGVNLLTRAVIKLLSKPPDNKQAISLSVFLIRFSTALVSDFLIREHAFSISSFFIIVLNCLGKDVILEKSDPLNCCLSDLKCYEDNII